MNASLDRCHMLGCLHLLMRKASAIRLSLPILAVLTGGAAEPRTVTVSVEFVRDGRCTVSADGEDFHSTLTYSPKPAREVIDGFRCAIPPVPPNRPLELTVTLAAGVRPSTRGSPRLDWVQKEGRWVGTAVLATAPEVVVVEDWHGRRAVTDRWLQRSAVGLILAGLTVLAFRRFRRRPRQRSL
jgi:hypothetical protein